MIIKMRIAGLLLWVLVVVEGSKRLPESFPRCKRGHKDLNKCIQYAMQHVIGELANGIPDLGLPPIDPLTSPGIEFKSIPGVDLSISNVTVRGLKDIKITNVDTDLGNGLSLWFGWMAPEASLEGDYEMKGTFKGQVVNGVGRVKFIYRGTWGHCDVPAQDFIKDNGHFRKASKFDLVVEGLPLLQLEFTGLKGGEKTNEFLNENWQDFWQGMKKTTEETYGAFWKLYHDLVFLQVPLENILLD